MKLNFQGRISNVILPFYRSLLPVFEALVNSFHALEDTGRGGGTVRIHVHRDTTQERQQSLIGGRLGSRRIVGFSVEDDGIGFTRANYESFETSDTDHKKERGAKGVGRFMWLKAYDSVFVDSVFMEDGRQLRRTFTFSLDKDGIGDHKLEEVSGQKLQTTVHLRGFKDKYEEACPRLAETISERIIEHCLSYFLKPNCPEVLLVDDDESTAISLNKRYKDDVHSQTKRVIAKCKGVELAIDQVRVFAGEYSQHTIHLCANARDVQHLTLNSFIPYIPSKFKATDGSLFVYKAYVSSLFLDQRVNAERTAFDLAKEGDFQAHAEPTEREILDAVVRASEIELGPLLGEVEQRIKARIETLVSSKFPEYRPLLKELDRYLREFRDNADESEILARLNDIQFREDLDARKEVQKLLKEQDPDVKRSKKYKELQDLYLEKANDIARSRLAQCVIHRRIILDLLEAAVSVEGNGKYPKEEKIHEIIFPLRTTSDDIDTDRQNLWIVDERLAFHRFLASDKPLKTFSDSLATDEPDLFVLNHPGVFSNTNEAPLSSAVIIEFKRAERENLNESPFDQVYRYVRKLAGREIKDGRGRTVQMHPNAIFYCYIVADLTEELRRMAEDAGLDPTTDGMGFYGFNRNRRAYVEVLSYEKLMKDSLARNRELFKALGLEP